VNDGRDTGGTNQKGCSKKASLRIFRPTGTMMIHTLFSKQVSLCTTFNFVLGTNYLEASYKTPYLARCRRLTPVILATQEAEIRSIVVRETLSQKTLHKNRDGKWLKVMGLSSNPSTAKTNKQTKNPPHLKECPINKWSTKVPGTSATTST
jgi:hypothetical protein